MNTKLTLKLDKDVIEKAKIYAGSHKNSLSKLVESYLKTLINQDEQKNPDEIEISAFVKSMSSGIEVPANIDIKKAYRNHLLEKHK